MMLLAELHWQTQEEEAPRKVLAIISGFAILVILLGLALMSWFSTQGVHSRGDSVINFFGAILVFFGVLFAIMCGLGIIVRDERFRALSALANRGPAPSPERLCAYCNMPIRIGGSTFCPSCGARLITMRDVEPFLTPPGEVKTMGPAPVISAKQASIIAEALRIRKRERAGKCMVCNLDLKSSDLIAWCPHCGNPAHRDHLIRWVQENRTCPLCREHLEGQELVQQLSQTTLARARASCRHV